MDLIKMFTDAEEDRKKGIPSKVFFNHFYAIFLHISSDDDKYNLKRIDYFNNLKLRNDDFNLDDCKKLLWNSWSTEYAFNLATNLESDDYYKFSLHWNFPQAYYSIYLAMTAFHETQGTANDQHEKSIKIFGNSVKDNHYPKAISFFTKGNHNEFDYLNLDEFDDFPENFTALSRIVTKNDAQIQIASFLKSTRKGNAKNKRTRLEKKNDIRFHTQKGIFTKSFRKKHWDLIYKTIPETTILNIIYRLRIKANYQDIETFINADINFKEFHNSLGNIVSYLNFIHESYICKVIGNEKYEKILYGFNEQIGEKYSVNRYQNYIKE